MPNVASKRRKAVAKCAETALQTPAFERRDIAVVRVIYSKARANLKTHWESAEEVRTCRGVLVAAIRAVHRGASAVVRARRVLESFARLRQSKGQFNDVLEVVGFFTQWSLSAPQDAIDYLLAAAKEMAWCDKKELDALVASVRRVASDMQERQLPGKLADLSGKRARWLADSLSTWTNSADRDSTANKPVKHDQPERAFEQHQRPMSRNNARKVMEGWQDFTVSDALPDTASTGCCAVIMRDATITTPKSMGCQTSSEPEATRNSEVIKHSARLQCRQDLTPMLKPCISSKLMSSDEDIGWSSTASHASDDMISFSGTSSPRQASKVIVETNEELPTDSPSMARVMARHASHAATGALLATCPLRHEPNSDAEHTDDARSDRPMSTGFRTAPHQDGHTSEINPLGYGRYILRTKSNLACIDQTACARNVVQGEDSCDGLRRRRSRRVGKQDRAARSRGFALSWSGSMVPSGDLVPGMGGFGFDSASENCLRGEPAELASDLAMPQWRSLIKSNLFSSVRSMPALRNATSSAIGQRTNNFSGTNLRDLPMLLKANTTMLAPISTKPGTDAGCS